MPSPWAALTSARRCSSVRTAARSIFSIASASGASAAAAGSVTADKTSAAAYRPNDVVRVMIPPPASKRQQLVDLPLAVRKSLEPDADLLEQRQVQVRQRRRLLVGDVAGAPHSPRPAP